MRAVRVHFIREIDLILMPMNRPRTGAPPVHRLQAGRAYEPI